MGYMVYYSITASLFYINPTVDNLRSFKGKLSNGPATLLFTLILIERLHILTLAWM